MKTIRFEKVTLSNFCGIDNAEIEFYHNITTICGRNGIGKSTIFNAIYYVLFGTDQFGNALDIKTYDSNHQIIREIPHEASLTISVDGEETTFKRTLTDLWKGEQVKNTYKYFIDGEVVTAGDYRKAIENICPEKTFRLCSSATAFTSMPWQEQRKFLQSLVPEVTQEDITQGDTRYDFITEELKKRELEAFIHHLKYTRKEVQDNLDKVPVRLAELNNALPQAEDWEKLAAELDEAKKGLREVSDKINLAQNGATDSVRNEGLRRRIEFTQKRIDEMTTSARNLSNEEATKHESDLISARAVASTATRMVDELKQKMEGLTNTEIQATQHKEECEAEVSKLNERSTLISQMKWEWDDADSMCPHCGQPLPLDRVAELKQQSHDRFNKDIADRQKELQKEFSDLQQRYTDIKKLIENTDEERRSTTNQLTEAQKAKKQADIHLKSVLSENVRTTDDFLAANENYRQASEELQSLTDELNKPSDATKGISQLLIDLKKQQAEKQQTVDSLSSRLAAKETYDHISTLISNAQGDKAKYQEQLDNIDQKLDTANDYQQKACQLLEERVNKHFSYVQFSLFKSTLEGERKQACECYHDGVPYSSLNTAAKVNAGIDIAYTVAEKSALSVPIILDECESNLSPIYRGGQQIRLCVTPSPNFEYVFSDGD